MIGENTHRHHATTLSLKLPPGRPGAGRAGRVRHREYGYSLKKLLSDKGLEIDEGTLYPLLRRLESQGLLKSAWRVEDGRPRRYYQASAQGEKLAKETRRRVAGARGRHREADWLTKERDVMDLIDCYAHEVGQHLPHRLRADVGPSSLPRWTIRIASPTSAASFRYT